MVTIQAPAFSIEEFLRAESRKDLFRFSTAGSVDDGKSTLIGRLLYDTQSVYDDQVNAIEGKGTTAPGQLDFALLTDGLRAEREQGITIDVAYRYFSTARRKFIIADTPGHEQYTRNMATGASTADAAIVLIDASKGVQIQSRRHAYIASLLGVRHLLVAVNKMDLVGYDEERFRAIEAEFIDVLNQIANDTGTPVEPAFVPVSALKGDNVVHRAERGRGRMPWYLGPSLLELLERLPSAHGTRSADFRFPVQQVLRPDHTFRGFAGQIASGTVRPGETITVLPSRRAAKVQRIVTWDGDLTQAAVPLSVTLVLDRDLDISRGDLIMSGEAEPIVTRSLQAALVWMDQQSLDPRRRYLLKHASQTVPAFVGSIDHRVNLSTITHEASATLHMNDIGVVSLSLLRHIAADRYADNRVTGAFILIDSESNATVAAGMICAATPQADADLDEAAAWGAITPGEREARWGHRGAVLSLSGPSRTIDAIERSLFSAGAVTCRMNFGEFSKFLDAGMREFATAAQTASGILSLIVRAENSSTLVARIGELSIEVEAAELMQAISAVHQLLRGAGVFIPTEKAGL